MPPRGMPIPVLQAVLPYEAVWIKSQQLNCQCIAIFIYIMLYLYNKQRKTYDIQSYDI